MAERDSHDLDLDLDDDARASVEAVPEAWFDAAAGDLELEAIRAADVDADIDDASLRELLRPLDDDATAAISERAVAGFFADASGPALAVVDPSVPVLRPGFASEAEDPRLPPLARTADRRPWWRLGLPLAAAAILLVVIVDRSLVDGPGELRVDPATHYQPATAAVEDGRSTPDWPKAPTIPVPGGLPHDELTGEPEEEETPRTKPQPKAPDGVPGGVPGGVVGGVVGGVAGGVAKTPHEPAGDPLPDPANAVIPRPGRDAAPTVERPIEAVMEHGLYTPDPQHKALSTTKAATFDGRPCANETSFCVDARGRTSDVRTASRCYDPAVDEVCRDTVSTWRFKPFIVDGEATKVCTTVRFDLKFNKRR